MIVVIIRQKSKLIIRVLFKFKNSRIKKRAAQLKHELPSFALHILRINPF